MVIEFGVSAPKEQNPAYRSSAYLETGEGLFGGWAKHVCLQTCSPLGTLGTLTKLGEDSFLGLKNVRPTRRLGRACHGTLSVALIHTLIQSSN
jgi:hypothetical protein